MKIKTRPQTPVNIDFSAQMQSLLDEAYQLFDKNIGNCLNVCSPCCVSEAQIQELVSTPVNELKTSLIYDYLDAVHYDQTQGEIKHFLPRILELLVKGENIRHSTELILDKCHCERAYWSEKELEFLRRFAAEFLRNILSRSPNQSRVGAAMDYIVMFDLAGLDTWELLNIWVSENSFTSLEHFVAFVRFDLDQSGFYDNSFSVNATFNENVMLWFLDDNTQKHFASLIEKEYFENPNLTDEQRYWLDMAYGRITS